VVAAAVVVLVVAAAGTVVAYGPDRLRALGVPAPTPTPTVPRPTPTPVPPALATPSGTATPDAAAIRGRLGALLASKSLGKGFGAYVVDEVSGAVLVDQRGTSAVTPASTAKLATTTAALASLGPQTRFTTSVVRGKGGVTLVGGGDPTLLGPGRQPPMAGYPKYARLATLAAQTAKALGKPAGRITVRVDDSLYSGPRLGPGWKPNYVPDGNVAPVDALMIDHGQADPRKSKRVGDPAVAAGRAFASLLAKHGVHVSGTVTREKTAKHAATLAQVRSPTVGDLVEETLTNSDNDMAEALARHVALNEGLPGSFPGGASAVHTVLARLGVADGIHLYDGSGLSPYDRVTAQALARVLRLAASSGYLELGSVPSGLPVGGYTGTLTTRFGQAHSGVGVVRAKTGTLDGVSSLAGYVQDRDGRVIVFAFVANGFPRTKTLQAEVVLDRLAAGLASCGCG
ncbi:MAG: D-alanyl-D-alanine carboxypeptidase/D-alanyl-D-alanine-endopeptidase, partial [Acidothermales bacterium]|nr:D-alanyl-D-alanine carboxypeptidase/D-alanyl-D-alanine-endopeptidase [Acidothermales bacterium]